MFGIRSIGTLFTATAMTCGLAGCSQDETVSRDDLFSFKPVDYKVFKEKTLLAEIQKAKLSPKVLEVAELRGRLLMLLHQKVISEKEFEQRFKKLQIDKGVIYPLKDSLQSRLDSGISYDAYHNLDHAEAKGMLDQLLDDKAITPERYDYISARLDGIPGFTSRGTAYLYFRGLKDEKSIIEKAHKDGIINADTMGHFNTPEWFKLGTGVHEVESLFEAVTFGVKSGSISKELGNKFVRANYYETANRVARLQVLKRLQPEDSEAILTALNKTFISPREQYPYNSRSVQEYHFERKNIIPRIADNDAKAGRISSAKAGDIKNRVQNPQYNILTGVRSELDDLYKELGINKYKIPLK